MIDFFLDLFFSRVSLVDLCIHCVAVVDLIEMLLHICIVLLCWWTYA